MLVSSITPRGGRAIGISPITALVGPNNSGKTACLRDILQLLTFQYRSEQDGKRESEELVTLVLDDMDLNPDLTRDDLIVGLRTIVEPDADTMLQGLGPDGCGGLRVPISPDTFKVLHRPRLAARAVASSELARVLPLRVSLLSLEDRLTATNSDSAGSPLETPANLLQLLQLAGSDAEEKLNEACQTIFGGDPIWLDASELVRLCLRTGARPNDEDLPTDLASRASLIRQHRLLDDEGQGLRSCVAILLNLILGTGRLVLLDQPELFLHPAQAMRFGRWIARNVESLGCQVILSTHSVEFLAGVSQFDPSQLALLRMERDAENTHVTKVSSAMLDPVVETATSRQQLLQALFSDGIVLVDRHDDLRIVQHLTHRHLGHSRVAICHCQDQALIGQIAAIFRKAGLPAVICARFDVMERKSQFVQLIEDITGKDFPTSWQGVREKIARHMEQQIDPSTLATHTREIEQFLDTFNDSGEAEVSTQLPELEDTSRWSELSTSGLDTLPAELQAWVNQMLEELKVQGVFIAPRGTLSSWWPYETQMAPLYRQLAQLDDGKCPPELREFVTNMNDYIVVQQSL